MINYFRGYYVKEICYIKSVILYIKMSKPESYDISLLVHLIFLMAV